MMLFARVHVVALALLCASRCPVCARKRHWSENFVCTRHLADGEMERRVRWGRVTAVETAVELAGPEDADQGLVLRQVTDGRHFIQLIYDAGHELRDCEYLRDSRSVDGFLRAFRGCLVDRRAPWNNTAVAPCCGGHGNSTLQLLPRRNFGDLTSDLAVLTDYRALRSQCHDLHRRVLAAVRHQQSGKPASLLDRIKRDLFLYPGTNWCGSGSSTRRFNELGYNAAADRCCRDHDHCPHTVEGFTRKFNFFNYRFHTVSHCDCDERFRACLKLSNTAAANMVGKLFFNVVQTKCFLFKMEKTCSKRSWWGKCLQLEEQKTAKLRDALTY